jgi:hypothetical protein
MPFGWGESSRTSWIWLVQRPLVRYPRLTVRVLLRHSFIRRVSIAPPSLEIVFRKP